MRKILWFSEFRLNTDGTLFFGTWHASMARLLLSTNEVELYNVTQGKVKQVEEVSSREIKEWVVPTSRLSKSGLPSEAIIRGVKAIVDDVKPDLIHIWGMEQYWALLSSRGFVEGKVLLEIQGIKRACADVFYGGLNALEVLSCVRVQELVFPDRMLYRSKLAFKKWGTIEEEMIRSHRYIATQSDWVRHRITIENAGAKIYHSGIVLRDDFFESEGWTRRGEAGSVVIMTSSSFAVPYKGVHTLLHTLALLKKKYTNVKLKIAGKWEVSKPFYRKSGYLKWFEERARALDVYDSLQFLGPLNSGQLIDEMLKSDVFVVPSYVESYCLALAEAMALGIPCVASYAGAMGELAENNKSALFFPPGDVYACAAGIDRIITEPSLADLISEEARIVARKRNNKNDILLNQLAIYDDVINDKNSELVGT